jgi:LAS superfamily LD-carboxypeptidase LdcB
LVNEIQGVAPVTLSAGIATFPANAHTAQGLVRAADEALEEAKRSGGERSRRSTRGSLYRSNERRKALGKAPVARLEDRRPAVRKTVTPTPAPTHTAPTASPAEPTQAEPQEPKPVMSVAKRLALLAPLVTAKPAPASLSTGTIAYDIEAKLRELANARSVG